MNAKDLKPEALVDRLLPKGNLVILTAEGGTGKSTFCYEIAEAVSTGNKLFGQLDTSKGNVKVVQCDESPTDAQVKFDIMDYKLNNALQLQQDAEAGRKLYLEQKRAQEEWYKLPLGHPAKAPTPESV